MAVQAGMITPAEQAWCINDKHRWAHVSGLHWVRGRLTGHWLPFWTLLPLTGRLLSEAVDPFAAACPLAPAHVAPYACRHAVDVRYRKIISLHGLSPHLTPLRNLSIHRTLKYMSYSAISKLQGLHVNDLLSARPEM